MRKKSKYKPKGVRLDNLTWVSAGFQKVGSLPSAGVALKLKNHEALEAVLKGYATRDHVDVLIAAFNVGKNSKLIYPGYFMFTLNGTLCNPQIKSTQMQCFLIDETGNIKTIHIPFHLILRFF